MAEQLTEDPWWLPGCLENLKKIPNAVLCTENHCNDAQNYWHAVCNCQAPYSNGCPDPPTAGCCSYTATSPIFVTGPQPCYCCCGCLANDTLVCTSANEVKAIQEFMVGDLVYVAMDPYLETWDQLPVVFSSGTGPESVNDLIQVRFGDPDSPRKVLASRNQLFMVQGNRLKRASKLVPLEDSLVQPDGSTVTILDLTAGKFEGGVHQISTSGTVATDWAGHLMIANGVVCGDYSLQLTNLEVANPELLVAGHNDLPEFGTRLYAERYAHLFASELRAHGAEAEYADDHAEGFQPLLASTRPRPGNDSAFITHRQALDIQENAPRQPPYSGAGTDILKYLFKLYQGFYPTITFYLDAGNELPNAYSVREYGSEFVVVNGGLIRTDVIQYEALAFVIAHQISVLRGGDPKDPSGNTCRGQADYNSILGVFPYVWFGLYSYPLVQPAIDQITAFFDFIDPEHREGLPGNRCNEISIDCRLKSLAAASVVASLPECAGGPPAPTLTVTGARAGEDGASVTVGFNEPVDVESAGKVGAYAFTPLAPATRVTVAPDALSSTVEAQFEPEQEYEVTVQDVTSASGHPLNPKKSSAYFTTPPKGA